MQYVGYALPRIYLLRGWVNKDKSRGYIDSIPGAIPPSKDVTKSIAPPPTMTTPKGRAMWWLSGIVFSAKMMTAALSIQVKFIIPRGCYELARQWLANGENGRPTVNRANRAIRILMRVFSQVHNTL